jgi:hypothetical protein
MAERSWERPLRHPVTADAGRIRHVELLGETVS